MTSKPLSVNVGGIPDALKVRRQWLGYTPVWNEAKQKYDKPNHGRWGERQHWRTFDHVIASGQRPGFIYGDGVCGLDVDRCVVNDVLSAEAQSYVDRLQSYTEYSLSGTGIHILAFGSPLRRDLKC